MSLTAVSEISDKQSEIPSGCAEIKSTKVGATAYKFVLFMGISLCGATMGAAPKPLVQRL